MTDLPKSLGYNVPWSTRVIRALKRDRWLYLIMLLPALYYILFWYYPMYGVTIAFKDFKPKLGIPGSPWTSQHGMKYVLQVVNDPYFWTVFKNTIVLNVENLLVTFPAPIILALLLNELTSTRYKRVVQTVTYLPHFLSTVVVVGMLNTMFNSTGIVNEIIASLGFDKINFLNDAQYFRPMYIGSNVWQSIGWDSIIYLAAIAGVDTALYEAAEMDGCGKLGRIWHITLPGIRGTIGLLFIMGIGGLLSSGFEQIYLLRTPGNMQLADTLDVYVVNVGLMGGQFGYASAIGLVQGVVGLIMVVTANKICKKMTEVSLW